MADPVIENFPDKRAACASPYIAGAWFWWQRTRGLMDRGDKVLGGLMRRIQLGVMHPEFDAPPYLFVGPNSTLAEIYGEEWCRDAAGQPGLPDGDFEKAVNAVYSIVDTYGDPRFDRLSNAEIALQNGGVMCFDYERLVVPGVLECGSPILACFGEFIGTPRRKA